MDGKLYRRGAGFSIWDFGLGVVSIWDMGLVIKSSWRLGQRVLRQIYLRWQNYQSVRYAPCAMLFALSIEYPVSSIQQPVTRSHLPKMAGCGHFVVEFALGLLYFLLVFKPPFFFKFFQSFAFFHNGD